MSKTSKRYWSAEELTIIKEYGEKGGWKATKVAREIHAQGLLLNRSHEQVVWQLRLRRPRKKLKAPPIPLPRRPPGFLEFRQSLPEWLSPNQRSTALTIASKVGIKAGERYVRLCDRLHPSSEDSAAS